MFPPAPAPPQGPDVAALAQNALQDDKKRVPGPGDVGPTISEKTPLLQLTMTKAEADEWKGRIDRSRNRVKNREKQWDSLLKEYTPTIEPSGHAEDVKTNKHFRNVHSKIGQLFYRSPDLVLTPRGVVLDPQIDIDPRTGQPRINPLTGQPVILTAEDIVSIKQEALNQKLGRDGIKATRLIDELLFDNLAWSGISASKLGYSCTFKEIQEPVTQPDPNWVPPPMAPGNILGLGGAPQPPMVPVMDPKDPFGQTPMMRTVKVPIYEEYYWRRMSPKKVLFNDDLRSTRYDEDATWEGMEFFIAPKRAQAVFKLTDAQIAKCATDDRLYKHEGDEVGTPALLHGVEIWSKAAHFRDDQPHPQAIDQIVFIDGVEEGMPSVYRPSPDQTFDDRGRLTEDSLIGFPIRILTIRDYPDSPFPISDSGFTNSGIKQLNTYRKQGVQLRDAQIGKYLYDQGSFDVDEITILKNGAVGDWVGVEEGKLALGIDKILGVTPQVKGTRDDYQGAALLERDIDETLGISSVQAGTPEATVRSATEIANVATAIAARNEKEQGRVVDFYLDGARMIDSLMMRYATQDEYVHIAGQDGLRKMVRWNNKLIAGKWMYDIAPDSQARVDTAQDRTQTLTLYNLTAADPLVNRNYLLRRLCRLFGMDPSKLILDPTLMMSQPPHGGGSSGAPVNKHEAGKSGGRPNQPGNEDHRQQTSGEPGPV